MGDARSLLLSCYFPTTAWSARFPEQEDFQSEGFISVPLSIMPRHSANQSSVHSSLPRSPCASNRPLARANTRVGNGPPWESGSCRDSSGKGFSPVWNLVYLDFHSFTTFWWLFLKVWIVVYPLFSCYCNGSDGYSTLNESRTHCVVLIIERDDICVMIDMPSVKWL